MFLLPHFMNRNGKKYLIQRIEEGSGFTDDKDETVQDRADCILRCYDGTINDLSQTCADNGTIGATDAEISIMAQRDNKSPIAFNEVIFQRTLHYSNIYDQADRIYGSYMALIPRSNPRLYTAIPKIPVSLLTSSLSSRRITTVNPTFRCTLTAIDA